MLKTPPSVTIILLDYNSNKLTKTCIESIITRLNYNNYQLILVDNSESKKFSHQYLKKNNVTYIKNDKNLGFATGCNIGIKYAIKNFKSDFFWLLNSDTTIEKNSLINMIDYSYKNNISITGSQIINPLNNNVQCLGGGYLNKIIGKSYFITKESQLNKLEYICGASMLISKNTIETIGYLDEDFFLYYEDSEYCDRAKRNNLKIGCSTNSIIYHIESSTTGKIPENKILFTITSFIIFCRKTNRYITCYNGLIFRLCFLTMKLQVRYLKNYFKALMKGFKKNLSDSSIKL